MVKIHTINGDVHTVLESKKEVFSKIEQSSTRVILTRKPLIPSYAVLDEPILEESILFIISNIVHIV